MKIANAAYDVVFKYLMQDNRVAKVVISALMGEEVEELVFKSTDIPLKKADLPAVLRMDFAATIKTKEGKEKKIIIELQKAKYYMEVMRFREYLGAQYADPENKIPKAGLYEMGRPIFPIYILGSKITKEVIPVLRSNNCYIDVATNEQVEINDPFIKAVTHEALFVQLPHLKEKRRTDLELLLSVFDTTKARNQILEIKESTFPAKYKLIIRRLKKAIEEPEVAQEMTAEDNYLHYMDKIEEKYHLAEREKLAERAKAEAAIKREKEEKERAEVAEEALKVQQKQFVQMLSNEGKSADEISAVLGLPLDLVKKIMK